MLQLQEYAAVMVSFSGSQPRALCMLGEHATNRATSPALQIFLADPFAQTHSTDTGPKLCQNDCVFHIYGTEYKGHKGQDPEFTTT